MLLAIEHETAYHYAQSVTFNPHRLMVRAIEGHDVQIRDSHLAIQPAARVRWLHDVFGNSVAMVDFQEPAPELRVLSRLAIQQYNTNPFDFLLEPYAAEIPFRYPESEWPDVAPFQQIHWPADQSAVRTWLRPFLSFAGRSKTIEFLTAVTRAVPLYFQYQRRDEPGVQNPAHTIRSRTGSCRDFALLLMEAARHLGLAARFVSGYLCRAEGAAPARAAADATHAWAEIYLPGAGWKGFDPTSGVLAADLHARVAVAREPSQATPVQGSYQGNPKDYLGMRVQVDARAVQSVPAWD